MATARQRAEARVEEKHADRPAPAAVPAASIVALQRTAGNQAVARMLKTSRPTLQRMTYVDVLGPLIDTGDWTAAKKKARAKEIQDQTKDPDTTKADAQAAKEVDSADKSAQSIKDGTIITLAEWEVMKKGLTEGEYDDVIVAFNSWKGDPKDKEKFLSKVPAAKLGLFNTLVAEKPNPTGDPLDKQVAASPNAARAQQALKELTAIQKKGSKNAARLTDPIIALLVWGVAERRAPGDLGTEGILGIDTAVNAGKALCAISTAGYLDIVMQLDLAGGWLAGWDAKRVESALILKAVAARKSQYEKHEAEARKEIDAFAGEIRGEDTAKLTEQTSLRDAGGGTGLQQKFTMSCGPTTIQIIHGEADPIYALDISKTAKHDLDYKSTVGTEQEKILGLDAAPRTLKPRWDAFKAALNGLTPPAGDVPKWQALLAWMGGNPFTATDLPDGKKLANGLGFPDAELDEFKKYIKGLQAEPGLGVSQYQNRIKAAKIAGVTNVSYPLKQFTAAKRPKDKDLEEMWNVLFRGRDILFGVFWSAGGGHYMTLTDCRGDPKLPGSQRDFLLSDPWQGDSQWVSGTNLAAGNFGTTGTGYIDDIYY